MLKALITLVFAFFVFGTAAQAFDAFQEGTFKDFKILSADKLNFKDGNSILKGKVKVQFQKYTISAHEATVHTEASSPNPELIVFAQDVYLQSNDLQVEADRMEIDLKTSLFKCFVDDKPKVVSRFDDILLESDYQEYSFDTGVAKASSHSNEPVLYTDKERKITSQTTELLYKKSSHSNKNELESVIFSGEVILLENDKRIEAEELQYIAAKNEIRISNNSKVLYESDKYGPIYLFADLVLLELDKDLFSAYANSMDKSAELYANDMYGKARQITMTQKDKEADRAVLTGNAQAYFKDKALLGEEILFDVKNQEITTLLGRPMTKLF